MSEQKGQITVPNGFELVPRSTEHGIPEERLLEVAVAREIFGCTVHVIEMQDFSRLDKYVVKRFVFAVPPGQRLDLTSKEQLLKNYATSLHDAQAVIERVVRDMAPKQTFAQIEQKGRQESVTGYGAAMNLQFVRLEYAAVENWQADFFEVGKLGPIETTKRVGVGKVPAEAICKAGLAVKRSDTPIDEFRRYETKEWKMVRSQQIEAGPTVDIIDVPKALPRGDKDDE